MGFRENLKEWVKEALGELGGRASINEVARQIWLDHEADLKSAGDYFYSWQYDMRWAAQRLRDKGALGFHKVGSKSVWTLR
ncbi:MAG: hypothetical protein KF780_03385 [Sphingomonas sp.]|nr:hypothetical protein [Sphingomonas sp.]